MLLRGFVSSTSQTFRGNILHGDVQSGVWEENGYILLLCWLLTSLAALQPDTRTQFFLNAFSPFFFFKTVPNTQTTTSSVNCIVFFKHFLFWIRRWRWKLLIYTTTGKRPDFCLSNPRWPIRRGARLPRPTPSSSGCKLTYICNIQQVCVNSS